ncbi:papain-like cysteine protease family protein [Desulfoluna sp.]|uniref:papain-like cysteine protease family protein n=1 Tax=Desulfoluna sp. TaxID=2045199 RepID=UPI0026366768|nr:papain-like cysteine protease family protein [Desulfoluna sp.]
MQRESVNAVLVPVSLGDASHDYSGHFVKVSYIQALGGNSVFSKDRSDVAGDGSFRFFIPKKELLTDERVTVEVYAPDGELLGRQLYSYGSLNAADISGSADDETSPLAIEVDPKIITFNDMSPAEKAYKKISGKLIDLTGERKATGLQLIVMASEDPHAAFDSESYTPVFSAVTDQQGYFFGRAANKTYQQVYGVIAGLEAQPVAIALDDGKLPKEIILVADLSDLPECFACNQGTPALPDGDDLVNSPAFSQDLGGHCVDFTVPNRTLEEFSFYHTVRTTEPEIKGLTITTRESKLLRNELFAISDDLFALFGRLNNSLTALSVIPYSVDEEITESADEEHTTKRSAAPTEQPRGLRTKAAYAPAVYRLQVSSGINKFKLNTQDLLQVNKDVTFSDLIKVLSEQDQRKKKLLRLHQKLAAAYCGKHGVQEAKTYCETLGSKATLNRETMASLLGHIKEYADFIKTSRKLSKAFDTFLAELRELLKQPYVDSSLIDIMKSKCGKLIHAVDKDTPESQDQEELLGYLRRIMAELVTVQDDQLSGFEPCPPLEKTDTVGILCLMHQFDDIKETLRDKSIFSLGEIVMMRSNYDTFLASISSFLNLLGEFHSFYTSSSKYMISLEDDYFIKHYDNIKNTLISFKRQIYRAINKIEEIERAYISNHPGRKELSVENSVDWDETPTIYENTTIAHGHILHFKQKWKADGYSLGDLLYSLPLAPCQEKQIAIVDWDREERAGRVETQTVSEELAAGISRDRDISEIISSSFRENINASSTNKTSSTSAGIGGALGGFLGPVALGLAGGVSHSGASSKSTAAQNSARNLSGSSLNRLQDTVAQSASALRSQRNTVIQTIGQNETVNVQTEVIKNNNHCHAMTVEYFEVLKHYAIEQELVDVQECLFVPLPMSYFDHQKVLRWNHTLRRAIYGRKLRRGFDAIERIETNYANSDLPEGTYGDENIEEFTGHFSLSFELTRPYISAIEELTKTEEYDLSLDFPWFFGKMVFNLEREVPLTEQEKDAVFEAQYAPEIVRSFIETLQVDGVADDGTEETLELDFTLLSHYRRGMPLRVSIASKEKQIITRKQIKHLRFRANTSVKRSSKIILRTAYLHYRTHHLSEYIVRNGRVNNDIINTTDVKIDLSTFPWFEIETKTDAALIYTPLSSKELRDPRKEDREAASLLINFLNEHMERAHKIIWMSMDESRLFGLLDGYIAPHSGGRSVASVVGNNIIGVVGNNLVLNVVPGERLDPVFRKLQDLLAYYQPTTPQDPFRISVPTKGVYAESVLGRCNSCEEIDDTRLWRFEESPCGSKPTPINAVSTESRKSDPGNLQVKDLPAHIVNMQSAPAAPDPTGLAAAYALLGKGDAFKDMTGLAGTQANALQALQTTSKSVTDLAGLAADIQKQQSMKKDIGKTLKTIDEAKQNNQITKEQANTLTHSALNSLVGEPTKKTKLSEEKEVKEAIKKASDNKKDLKIKRDNESVTIAVPASGASTGGTSFDYTVPGLVPIVAQPTNNTCWATVATMMLSWHDKQSYTITAAMDKAGAKYRTMFDNDEGLKAADHEAFALACGMKGEPPMSYTISGIRSLIETHGPLIAIADEAPGASWAIHARVIRGIYGDGTADNTFLRINDPGNGRQYSESFRAFAKKYEEVADAPRIQIMHY